MPSHALSILPIKRVVCTRNHKFTQRNAFFVVNPHCLNVFDRKIIFHLKESYYASKGFTEWKNRITEKFWLGKTFKFMESNH